MEQAIREKMLNYVYYELGFDKVCSFKAYLIQARNDSDTLVKNLYEQVRRKL